MNAVVLVGGEGTRMRPLTETIPKPLIPFLGRPFLDHVLDHLAGHGVNEVICSSPYLEDQFRAFLDRRQGDPEVTWITEEHPLGTAGAIARARDHLDDTFVVVNGDVLTDLDVGALVSFHRDRGAVATISLVRVDDARLFGLVDTEEDGRVTAFREKPADPVPGTINAGTYVLEPRALDRVPVGETVSIERETFPDLIVRGEPVYGWVADGYWRDLGTPQAYLAAQADALEGRIGDHRPPLAHRTATVDPSAAVDALTVVGPGVRVEEGARVERSTLLEGAVVGRDAVVERSIVGPRAAVGSGSRIRDAVLGEDASVPAGSRATGAVGRGQAVRP